MLLKQGIFKEIFSNALMIPQTDFAWVKKASF
jgi:hypothetical protein